MELIQRRRWVYFLWWAAVVCIGLLSRSKLVGLPPFWAKYAGDAAWGLMVFVGLAMALPRRSSLVVAALALTICSAIELSQLYHAPWIDAVRSTWPGRLLLGSVFGWGDFLAYLAGVAIGAAIDIVANKQPNAESKASNSAA